MTSLTSLVKRSSAVDSGSFATGVPFHPFRQCLLLQAILSPAASRVPSPMGLSPPVAGGSEPPGLGFLWPGHFSTAQIEWFLWLSGQGASSLAAEALPLHSSFGSGFVHPFELARFGSELGSLLVWFRFLRLLSQQCGRPMLDHWHPAPSAQ